MIVSKLKEILDSRGIKYSYIASKVQINKRTMSYLINNKSIPTYQTAYYIAKELNLKMEEIWYFIED